MDTNIFSKCMLLVLETHSAGGDRKVRKDKLEVRKNDGESDPDAKSWAATKRIFGASMAYKAISTLDHQAKARLAKLEIPAQFQRGTFAIPTKFVAQAQEIVDEYVAERSKLVDAFCDEYSTVVGEQQVVLGPLFDITDYPPPDSIRKRFGVGCKWLSLGVPEQLAEVSQDLYDKQIVAQSKALQDTMDEVRDGLRMGLRGLIDHLLNRLSTKNEKGQVVRLHESAVTNIIEFLDMLPAKNITGDTDIQLLAEKARAIVTATDVSGLKTDGFSRAIVEKRLGQIVTELDKMVEAAPLRRMGGFEIE